MFFDEKKALSTIMGKHKPGETSATPMKNEVVKTEGGKLDGRHEAAQDLLAAIHEKSPEKINKALQNHHDLHKSMHSNEE